MFACPLDVKISPLFYEWRLIDSEELLFCEYFESNKH